MTWFTAPSLAVLILLTVFVGLAQITRPLELRPEHDYDAAQYIRLVDGLRSGRDTLPQSPFAYRVLPAAIVAASGLDVSVGFLALDVGALLATGLMLLALLRPYTTPLAALAAVVLWGLLPYGLRYAIHYPILTDYLGAFLVAALLLAVRAQRHATFALLLVAAVLTRESLMLFAPLPLLRVSPRAFGQRVVAASLAAVPGLAALVAVHVWPPVASLPASDGTMTFVVFHAYELLGNDGGEMWKELAAPLFAFGMLIGPLLSSRSWKIVRAEPAWIYLIVVTAITAALGGGDHDRYLFAIAPLILVIVVQSLPTDARTRLLLIFVPLQVIAARVLMPLGADWETHLAFGVSGVTMDALAAWSAVISGCAITAALISTSWDRLTTHGRGT